MKLLFLDDSFVRRSWISGYGGFCIDASALRDITKEFADLKSRFKIPITVEIKWSPGPEHFLRTQFSGVRHELYLSAIQLLRKYDATVICAIHTLKECFGVSLHGWSQARATLWAAKQQLRFITERFDRPYLTGHRVEGMIVCDQFGNRDDENTVTKDFSADMLYGTEYSKFERLAHVAFMTESKYSAPIQMADIVVGIVTSSFAENKYGLALFDEIVPLFLRNPHEKAIDFASTVSSAVLGFGLIVFPKGIQREGSRLFCRVDEQWVVTKKDGLHKREQPIAV